MLLVLDVGNTTTVIGVFEGEKLLTHWRVGTQRERTADEHGVLFKELLNNADLTADDIEGISISCVVPPLLSGLIELGRTYFEVESLVVGPGIKTGLPIHVDNPREVGADRIVNAVAAYASCQTAVIVIDFGTATTFDFISSSGTFEGGVIAPGINICTEALFREASKLPRVELIRPRRVIGKNTICAMQSGIVLGYAGLVDSMLGRIKAEVKSDWPDEPEPMVIATGGMARMLAPETESIRSVDEHLTLEGLRIIYNLNREEK